LPLGNNFCSKAFFWATPDGEYVYAFGETGTFTKGFSNAIVPFRINMGLDAEITGCSTQGGNAYACALQVTLGAPLPVNTVFSVGIGGGGFANPSGGDSPQVTAIHGCQVPPIPSPYLAAGNGSYTRYDVNIGPGGCTAGAVVTFREAVTGVAGATITQPVTVPELGVSTATFVLPPAPRHRIEGHPARPGAQPALMRPTRSGGEQGIHP